MWTWTYISVEGFFFMYVTIYKRRSTWVIPLRWGSQEKWCAALVKPVVVPCSYCQIWTETIEAHVTTQQPSSTDHRNGTMQHRLPQPMVIGPNAFTHTTRGTKNQQISLLLPEKCIKYAWSNNKHHYNAAYLYLYIYLCVWSCMSKTLSPINGCFFIKFLQ